MIATVTTLAVAAILYLGAMGMVVASGYNPYAIAAAAVIMTATIAYASWILAKICLLNDCDPEVAEALRGPRDRSDR